MPPASVRIGALARKNPTRPFKSKRLRCGFPAQCRQGNAGQGSKYFTVGMRIFASVATAGRGLPALAGLLRDRDQDLRHYAARGLVFFRDPSTLPALRVACRDNAPEVRNAARVAVRCIERSAAKTP